MDPVRCGRTMSVWLVEGPKHLVTQTAEVIVMTGRSNTATALGAIGALVGVVLILGGMGPMGEYHDADGFYMSDPLTVDRPSHAIRQRRR